MTITTIFRLINRDHIITQRMQLIYSKMTNIRDPTKYWVRINKKSISFTIIVVVVIYIITCMPLQTSSAGTAIPKVPSSDKGMLAS